jgi:uncharacterized OB-fold protein
VKPTPDTQHYWDAAANGELQIQWCNECATYYFYPRSNCPRCGSADVEWRRVSGAATLVSYVINGRPYPPLEPEPLIVALVQLAEGPRMMTNIVGVEPLPSSVELDMPLSVAFIERNGATIPVFTPKAVSA